jgi:hypothetical protein
MLKANSWHHTPLESDWIESTFNAPSKHFPTVNVVADKTTAAVNTDIQFCSGTDLSDQGNPPSRDACYSVCWTGTPGVAVVDPTNSDWKCSVCYNSSGAPVSCSTNGNAINWIIPAGTNYSLTSGTLASANPIIKFTSTYSGLQVGLNIHGSECGNNGSFNVNEGIVLPKWKEVSPF